MKSIGVTLQRNVSYKKLQKRSIVRHPAKLSNILGRTNDRKTNTRGIVSDKNNQNKLNRIDLT